jgi:hypothetical protein
MMKSLFVLLEVMFFVCLLSCEKSDADLNATSSFKATCNDASWISTTSWANYIQAED